MLCPILRIILRTIFRTTASNFGDNYKTFFRTTVGTIFEAILGTVLEKNSIMFVDNFLSSRAERLFSLVASRCFRV